MDPHVHPYHETSIAYPPGRVRSGTDIAVSRGSRCTESTYSSRRRAGERQREADGKPRSQSQRTKERTTVERERISSGCPQRHKPHAALPCCCRWINDVAFGCSDRTASLLHPIVSTRAAVWGSDGVRRGLRIASVSYGAQPGRDVRDIWKPT